MAITPTLQVDPTVMTNNWSSGLQNPTNQQKLIYKYNHPHRVFNYDPVGQQVDWQAGVTRALNANKYANGMQNADLNAASTNMTQYGGTNWGQAGTTKKYKYARKSANLAAAINQVMATVAVMPKGRGANNRARMLAWFDGMATYYGKI
jgi:hypothetical protein